MPFIPHTPESLLDRADSKNPATTCKGITTAGLHCRRSLNSARSPLNFHHSYSGPEDDDGVFAVLEPADDSEDDGAAAYFCWQHKDQAATLTSAAQNERRRANLIQLKPKTSIDTIAERLGVLDVKDDRDSENCKKHPRKQWERPARKETLPKPWQEVEGPLLAVPGRKHRQEEGRQKDGSSFAIFCCFTSKDPAYLPPARMEEYRGRPAAERPARSKPPAGIASSTNGAATVSGQPSRKHRELTTAKSARPRPSKDAAHIENATVESGLGTHTESLLSLLPKSLSPHTTSTLLAELARPVSPHDEAGYIYIFWLTSTGRPPPDASIAASLLDTDSPTGTSTPATQRSNRSQNDLLQSYASSTNAKYHRHKSLLLKIGRASNVQRRMNEWTRQCGYDLSLLRFYPYIPSSRDYSVGSGPSSRKNPVQSSSNPVDLATPPTKVPHAHKVERLIHLELADRRVRKQCENCGKEHREWFEVEGSRDGLRRVDGVVRRWVRWAESGAGMDFV